MCVEQNCRAPNEAQARVSEAGAHDGVAMEIPLVDVELADQFFGSPNADEIAGLREIVRDFTQDALCRPPPVVCAG
jgi:hypothetical protein